VAEDEGLLAARDPHEIADDAQGQGGGDLCHEIALTLVDQFVHDLAGDRLDGIAGLVERPRGEGARDDPAQAGMARIVHVDHGTEELAERLGEVGDVRARA